MSCFRAGPPAAEACSRAAGAIGRVWRQRRRDLPPDVRDLIAETLLALRIYVLPDTMLDAAGAIGRSRYDIRGISEMLKHLATQEAVSKHIPVTLITVRALWTPPTVTW